MNSLKLFYFTNKKKNGATICFKNISYIGLMNIYMIMKRFRYFFRRKCQEKFHIKRLNNYPKSGMAFPSKL